MGRLPRFALGTVQPQANSQPVTWALLGALGSQGLQVQHFRSQACFAPFDGVPSSITGLSSRHLDTWSMSPEICREVFFRAASGSDLAVVEGRYQSACESGAGQGSQLDQLCQWLDLPQLVVVDVRGLGDCRLPQRPPRAVGVLLDGIGSGSDLSRWQTSFETLWGLPVVGALEGLPQLREAIAQLPVGVLPPRELCAELTENFLRHADLEQIEQLAEAAEFPIAPAQLFCHETGDYAVRVAVAYDAAFHCYFPDTLDLLELRGAQVVDFSPLRDECLPAETDIVYFGCGHPEHFARELAANVCIQTALRNHVCSGRRIYAEGGGLAYLCRQIEMGDGARLPMVGVLPATARLNPRPEPPVAYEATLGTSNWLGSAGTQLRGYLNTYWELEAAAELASYVRDPGHELDLVGRHHAVGSRMHLNFAAQPHVFRSFLKPHAASLEWAQCRTTR